MAILVLGVRPGIVINIHLLIATHDNGVCKDSVLITHFILVECDSDLPRHCPMPVGHSPHLSSSSVCKSSLWLRLAIIDGPHRVPLF